MRDPAAYAVVGVGVDVVGTSRFERLLHRGGERVWQHWFTETEADECARHSRPALAAAVRFAVKEATYKAVGLEFSGGLRWRDIEVLGREPAVDVVLHGEAAAAAATARVARYRVSVCHMETRVLAMVLAEGTGAEPDHPAESHVCTPQHTTTRGYG